MKRFFVLFFSIFIFFTNAYSQNKSNPDISLKLNDKNTTGKTQGFYKTGLALFPLNPILLIENKKFYVGITKEISFGFFPYGRIAAEYSLIFRETRVNHVRFSYDYDFPIEVSDFAAIMITAGGGYFTDFNKFGYFPQISFAILFPLSDNIATNPYIKFRHTFMDDKNESDISDMSFGLGLYLTL